MGGTKKTSEPSESFFDANQGYEFHEVECPNCGIKYTVNYFPVGRQNPCSRCRKLLILEQERKMEEEDKQGWSRVPVDASSKEVYRYRDSNEKVDDSETIFKDSKGYYVKYFH